MALCADDDTAAVGGLPIFGALNVDDLVRKDVGICGLSEMSEAKGKSQCRCP
ncbi:hypothetical protein thalar_02473 [Litoreibacter arenae DSM 19593]|uniref:Uncharacterized protein n=1 Tax=Litoreibacter arenae DSM 19593 TaxID=1123360 RepID=S9RW64_9RHOB|nr:hypothetical protein thalar_02473 [Litoreibacter arenae DSM 19593]